MSYSTVEGILEKDRVIFAHGEVTSTMKPRKVLITFIDDDVDHNLYELDNDLVAADMIEESAEVLKKDKKLFTNI